MEKKFQDFSLIINGFWGIPSILMGLSQDVDFSKKKFTSQPNFCVQNPYYVPLVH